MAFIIRSKLEEYLDINNQFNPADAWSWRETQRVTFTRDGTLSAPSIIALGNQGDDWATRLECVIDGDVDISSTEYISRYAAHVVFIRTADGTRTSLDLIENKYLYVPQEITQNAGDYQMILVITEKDDEPGEEPSEDPSDEPTESTEPTEGEDESTGDTGDTGNAESDGEVGTGESTPEQAAEQQEIFTSQLFTGSVIPTLYPIIQKFHEIYDDADLLQAPAVNLKQTSLSKPIINLNATRGELEPINQKLGYLHDRFITPLKINTTWAGNANQFDAILLYFITTTSTDGEQPVVGVLAYSVLPENFTSNADGIFAWVPEQVTRRAGTWQIVMVGVDENGAEWYSNTITGQVIDNSLQPGDLDPNTDIPYLYDVNDNILVVSLNDEVAVPLTTRSTQSYKLNYTGAEVQALLDSIPTKQDQLTAGENIEITETDVISAEVPTFGVDPETGTLVVNTNKSK